MNKKVLLSVIIFGLIGFATGLNYVKIKDSDILSLGENCFQFGLGGIIEGKSLKPVLFELIFSSLKWVLMLSVGFLSWKTFPVTAISLFFLNFQSGIVFETIYTLLKSSDFLSVLAIFLFSFFVISFSVVITYECLCFRIERNIHYKLCYSDLGIFKRILIEFLLFLIIIFLLDLIILNSKSALNRMYFSFI